MLFFPKGSADTTAQAIVLQAPQGALLQFDKDFDLRKAKIGKLLGGKLDGPVSIYSSPNRPDGSDALYITTRDVDPPRDPRRSIRKEARSKHGRARFAGAGPRS